MALLVEQRRERVYLNQDDAKAFGGLFSEIGCEVQVRDFTFGERVRRILRLENLFATGRSGIVYEDIDAFLSR